MAAPVLNIMDTTSYNKYLSHTPHVGTTDLQQKCGLQIYTTKQLLPCLLFSSLHHIIAQFYSISKLLTRYDLMQGLMDCTVTAAIHR
jgi:hypothetical protein